MINFPQMMMVFQPPEQWFGVDRLLGCTLVWLVSCAALLMPSLWKTDDGKMDAELAEIDLSRLSPDGRPAFEPEPAAIQQ